MYFVCLKLYVHDICFLMHFALYLYLSLLFLVVCRMYRVLFTLFVGFCFVLFCFVLFCCFFSYSGVQRILSCVFVFYCLRFVYPMLSVSLDFQLLLSTSVFSYVYFASVADTFLFYWINVCFGDFM